MSILDQIYEHRKSAVAAQKQVPSQRPTDFQKAYELSLAPPLVSFVERVRQSPFKLSLMAEIKRASPSKGVISLDTCAPAQARDYALAGASVISVLTEPEWFKGSIEDLRSVRQALICLPHRPAVLRKDFVFEEYQILEARLAGADTVLLIVKMLPVETLTRLYKYSQTLKMEPLVEVHTIEEMDTAVRLGELTQVASVIGVNNRDLTSFEVDKETTNRLMQLVPKNTTLCALSGITGPQDITPYAEKGVGAVLVGEALMRAENKAKFVAELLGGDEGAAEKPGIQSPLLVKICGTRSAEAATKAIESGADLVGMILVTGTKRCVSTEIGLQISKAVHDTSKPQPSSGPSASGTESEETASSFFKHTAIHHLQHPKRALLVGVFRNQSLDYILQQQRLLNLDLVQLHGSEPVEWASLIPCPVIHSFNPGEPELGTRGYHAIPLLDSGAGGTGQKIATKKVLEELEKDGELSVMLAGGLNSDNVIEVVGELGDLKSQVVGVDVSSGVETDGKQDLKKIEKFVAAAKSIRSGL
ncbi:MAG: hypothetical protein Q9207_007076 [Kuettlingeria erythrocarpa]